jgi:phosphoribosylformylglycinamidine synthase subunit PurL
MRGCELPCVRIGTTGGDSIALAGEAVIAVKPLQDAFEGWFPAYMSGGAP